MQYQPQDKKATEMVALKNILAKNAKSEIYVIFSRIICMY
jgi:hypothetical protein